MLQLMLHAHPRLAVPPENRYTLPAYYDRADWGDLRRKANRRKLARFITRKKSMFRDFQLDQKTVRRRIVTGPPTLGSALEIVMAAFAESHGAARWCDKRPMYVRHVRALRRMFPDAQFLHLIRDGRSCTASLQRMPWFKGDLGRAIGTWTLAMEHAAAARTSLPADSWFDLRYERLLADPETELRKLCAFLGEEFDPAMLEPGDVKSALVPDRKVWHANTAGPLLTERAESWRRELPADDLGFIDAVAGRALRAHGYPAGGGPRPSRLRLARYAVAHQHRRAIIWRAEIADRIAVRRERRPVATRFTAADRAARDPGAPTK